MPVESVCVPSASSHSTHERELTGRERLTMPRAAGAGYSRCFDRRYQVSESRIPKLEPCESTMAGDGPPSDLGIWPVYACSGPLGHKGRHQQAKGGGHRPVTWTDEEAVQDRCPSLSPEPHTGRPPDFEGPRPPTLRPRGWASGSGALDDRAEALRSRRTERLGKRLRLSRPSHLEAIPPDVPHTRRGGPKAAPVEQLLLDALYLMGIPMQEWAASSRRPARDVLAVVLEVRQVGRGRADLEGDRTRRRGSRCRAPPCVVELRVGQRVNLAALTRVAV